MALSTTIFVLVILFGSSAWMGTNAVWMELPLITAVLPEGWSLPSFLAGVVQIACIGPLLYGISHKCLCNLDSPPLIIASLILASACCLGLVAAWDVTMNLFGSEYSMALYLLLFGIALVNSTSNVLFMPFMAQFHPHYLNAYFGGMGLSSLVPSLLSLLQGSSNYECRTNNGTVTPFYYPPRFGVSVFYLVIFGWTVVALVSFVILYRKGAHTTHRSGRSAKETPVADEGTPLNTITDTTKSDHHTEQEHSTLSPFEYTLILILTALVNAQMNGVIPSIHSYAALPYSQATYHWGITLSNIVSPLSSFLPFFCSVRSTTLLTLLAFTSSIVTAFIVYMATLSPNLFLGQHMLGSVLAIAAPMLAAGLHSYLRTVFASLLREGAHGSERRLFWCGVFIQIGSFVGSAVMFPLVNFTKFFQAASACANM